jgi:hypothetical protein
MTRSQRRRKALEARLAKLDERIGRLMSARVDLEAAIADTYSTTAERLAAEFAMVLADYIGRDKVADVRLLNAADPDKRICHSHDFCDANMVMFDAFKEIMGRNVDMESDADLALWSDAWKLFRG